MAEEEKTEIYSMMDDVKWIEERGKRKGIGEAKNKKRGYNDTNHFITQMKKNDHQKETNSAAKESRSRWNRIYRGGEGAGGRIQCVPMKMRDG